MFKHYKTMGEILWTGTLSSHHLKSIFPENFPPNFSMSLETEKENEHTTFMRID